VESHRGQRRLEECYCVPAHQCPAGSVQGEFASLIGNGFGSGASAQLNNGPVNNGQFNNGQFNNGQFSNQQNGQFNSQQNGQFNSQQNGQFNSQQNGQFNNGQFNNGQFNNGQFNDQVRGSPSGAIKDYSGLIDPRTLPKDILATENLDTLDLTDQPGVNNNRAR
jgi:hypothetical protein